MELQGFACVECSGEELAVHQIRGNVIGVELKERAKMSVGRGGVAGVHALHSQAIAGESIIGLLRDKLFEHLAAGFLLVGHWVVPYYTGAASGVQHRGARGSNEEQRQS